MLCQDCKQIDLCSCLCPEAELYVSQEWTHLQEITIGNPEFGKPWPSILRSNEARKRFKETYLKLSPKEKEVVTLLMIGFSRKEICERLDITNQNLRLRILRIKRKAKR